MSVGGWDRGWGEQEDKGCFMMAGDKEGVTQADGMNEGFFRDIQP